MTIVASGIGLYQLMAGAVVFAGISKAGFGSGAAFASASILALVMEPATALATMLPLLMVIDFVTLRPFWRKWSWPEVRILVIAAVPGVMLGVVFFRYADADLLRLLIGLISVLYVIWQISVGSGRNRFAQGSVPTWLGGVAGVLAGFTSFVSHAGGPAAAVYLLARRLDKTAYQATTVLVFGLVNLVKLISYAALGLFTPQTLHTGMMLVPFALLGAWLGVKAHHLVSERAFFGLTYTLLVLTGVKLIWDALV
jgi:uncharacterized membrane protein YfcA